MTLWVFGDSYAEQYNGLKEQWIQCTSNRLEQNIRCYGLVGSSAEYTYNTLLNVKNEIKEQDIIIIMLTTHSRRWFFKDYPNHTAQPAPGTDFKQPVSIYNSTGFDDVDNALSLYEDCLNNLIVFETYLENFLHNLNYFTKKLNLHTILIPNFYDTQYFLNNKKKMFSNIYFANGIMVDISLNEFTKEYFIEYNTSQKDVRINHLLKDNHLILADKIVDNIKNKSNIDLTTNFNKHIITKEKMNNKDFINEQLFGGIL